MTGVMLKEQYISHLPLLQSLNSISVIMLLHTFNIISLILSMCKGNYVILSYASCNFGTVYARVLKFCATSYSVKSQAIYTLGQTSNYNDFELR